MSDAKHRIMSSYRDSVLFPLLDDKCGVLYSEHVRCFTIVMSYLFPHLRYIVFLYCCFRLCTYMLIFFVFSFQFFSYVRHKRHNLRKKKKNRNGTNTRAPHTRHIIYTADVLQRVVLMKISWTLAKYDWSSALNRVESLKKKNVKNTSTRYRLAHWSRLARITYI